MMKKIVLSVAGLLLSASTFACTLAHSSHHDVKEVINKKGVLPIETLPCVFLESKGLGLSIDAGTYVRQDMTFAYAVVYVLDPVRGFASLAGARSMGGQTCKGGCTKESNENLLYEQIQGAIENLNVVKAADEIEAKTQKAKQKR